jgi:hypothetical protein
MRNADCRIKNREVLMTIPMSHGIIFVHYYGGTYIARFQGKTASCTGGKKQAAERVARKVMGKKPFTIERYGSEYAWKITVEE